MLSNGKREKDGRSKVEREERVSMSLGITLKIPGNEKAKKFLKRRCNIKFEVLCVVTV